ncbi:lipase secretion chaperone [Vibrio sp. 10N]|uniref:lipase secretion chaperone n=1 Tax=Vibrio sp. 10N TaxID=3058938 RepID=UPI0028133444|nr:lipase secretion chaperone [Vibrio sp. 10N]
MQTTTKWLLMLSVGCAAAAGTWIWKANRDSSDLLIQAPSQQDTQIDEGSLRDTFDYFLSDVSQTDVKTIEQRFEHYSDHSTGMDPQLFKKFIQYKAALAELGVVEDFDALHQQILALQTHFFTFEQQQRLFAEENQMRELALRQRELKQLAQSPAEYQQMWQQELAQLSPELQKSYYNANLLTALNETNSMDAQSQFLVRESLVGTEVTQRLATLDAKRARFEHNVQSYMLARAEIINNEALSEYDRQQGIAALREPLFDRRQLKSQEPLERLQKSSQQSLKSKGQNKGGQNMPLVRWLFYKLGDVRNVS